MASAASHRPTVEGEMLSTTPRVTASAASSAVLHRDSGTPVSAGNWQASAFTSASAIVAKVRSRPGRGRSLDPGQPLVNEAAAPLADGVHTDAQLPGDLR